MPASLARARRRAGRLRARAVLRARRLAGHARRRRDDRLLPRVDAEAAALVDEALREDGVDDPARRGGRGGRRTARSCSRRRADRRSSGCSSRPAAGRTSAGLEPLGLTIGRGGIEVDERMRAAENVWAIGDVTGIALFTHVGKYHARDRRLRHRGPRRPAPTTARSRRRSSPTRRSRRSGRSRAGSRRWPLTSTPRLSTYERPKRAGLRQDRRRPGAARPHRRRRRRPGGRRVAPAAHARDPRRDADRGAARRDPALPDLQRGRLPRAARARTSTS